MSHVSLVSTAELCSKSVKRFDFQTISPRKHNKSVNDNIQGRIQDFFRRGCTRILLYFNTNKPQPQFFWLLLQNTSCIRKPQVIFGGGGGVHPLHPPPRSVPDIRFLKHSF